MTSSSIYISIQSGNIFYIVAPDSSNSYLVLSRTLGQTLVHVQAIIQDGADTHNDGQRTPLTSIDLDDDSLFAPSPFTPRLGTSIVSRSTIK